MTPPRSHVGESRGQFEEHVSATHSHVPQYTSPIRVRAGEVVEVSRRDDEYPDWQWCRSTAGLEGWVPVAILEPLGAGSGLMREDYSAVELATTAGEHLVVERRLGGWALVRNDRDARGWVPEATIASNVDG